MTGEHPRTILVVDDDDGLRSAYRELLEGEGYLVLEAPHGSAALTLLTAPGAIMPDAMILDLVMPTMSGWELITIAKSYVNLAAVPIIIVSAMEPSKVSLQRGVVAAWLRKPVEWPELLELIRRHARAPKEASRLS